MRIQVQVKVQENGPGTVSELRVSAGRTEPRMVSPVADSRPVPLYFHQVEGAKLLVSGSAALWHEQGLGKTRAALTALRLLDRSAIIVCPAIAKFVWQREAKLCGYWNSEIVILNGTRPDPVALRFKKLIILNYDILPCWYRLLIVHASERALILDEAHYLRSPSTRRYRVTEPLAKESKMVWQLTGTPMVNSALDIYYELGLLGDRNPFRETFVTAFGERYAFPIWNKWAGKNGVIEYKGLSDEFGLMQAIGGIAQRRRKIECLDLPRKFRVPAYLASLKKSGINPDTPNPGALLAKLRRALAPLKVKLTIDFIDQQMEGIRPLVVFGWHREYLNQLQAHFGAKARVIDGDVSATERKEIIDLYEDGKVEILLIQIKAGGVAITLTHGNHAIFGEVHWSIVDMRQAEDRLHRPGQTRDVTYHYLLTQNSVEDFVWRVALMKGNALDRMDAAEGNLRDLIRQWEDAL